MTDRQKFPINQPGHFRFLTDKEADRCQIRNPYQYLGFFRWNRLIAVVKHEDLFDPEGNHFEQP